MGVLYSGFFLALLNHEINGHGIRAVESGYKVKRVEIGLFSVAVRYILKLDRDFFQKKSILSIGGNQANHLLSQKIAWDLVSKKRDIDNASAAVYIFSSQNQVFYSYFFKNQPGHDLASHNRSMQALYGKGSITINKIRSAAFLDFLDPILFASLCSSATGENVKIPAFNIKNVSITPGMNMVLTPYGVIEKRVVAYINTGYTPIMIAFGFGKEQKTNRPYSLKDLLKLENAFKYLLYYADGEKIAQSGDTIYRYSDKNSKLGKNVKNNNTYYLELKVGKIVEFGKLSIGTSLALWSQPELFTPEPRYAKIKNGGFASVDFYHNIKNNVDLFGSIGYKTKGFMIGKPVKSTPIVTVGLKLMI